VQLLLGSLAVEPFNFRFLALSDIPRDLGEPAVLAGTIESAVRTMSAKKRVPSLRTRQPSSS